MDPFMMGFPMIAPQRHRTPTPSGGRRRSKSPSQASTPSAPLSTTDSKPIDDNKMAVAPSPEKEKEKSTHSQQQSQSQKHTIQPPAPEKPALPFLYLPLSDTLKTLLLLALSILTLPLSYALAAALTLLPHSWISFLIPFSPTTPASAAAHRAACRADPNFLERTVLVTGVGMAKGLTLARAFWLCGHRVVAADFDAERCGAWTPWSREGSSSSRRERSEGSQGGRLARQGAGWTFSRAFDAVYSLRRPTGGAGGAEQAQKEYVRDVSRIMRDEDVELWVSCSGVASAVEDAMAQEAILAESNGCQHDGATGLRPRSCIQFDVPTTETLHEKSSFVRHTRKLDLLVPETHDITCQEDVMRALAEASRTDAQRKFILKPVGMDDLHRGNMTLLPLATEADTETYVRKLPISKERPWILQQFIRGNKEYCTHSLVVDGEVKVFVACPSSELLMHYEALAADDPLSEDMLEFTTRFADAEKKAGRTFTGHLSFDFMAETDGAANETRLYAIECNPRAHTAVTLFATPGPELRAMVDAYFSATQVADPSGLQSRQQRHAHQHGIPGLVRPSQDTKSRYWIGHDLFALVCLPFWSLVCGKTSRVQFFDSLRSFWEHVSSWQDGTLELWDPWPFVALFHHYWPRAILEAWLKGDRWSRVNVSTTKMFAC